MRRWPLYIALIAAAFFLQLVVLRFSKGSAVDWLISALFILPLAATIALVYAGADMTGTLETASARWERIVERAWAIILIDFAINMAQSVSYTAIVERSDATFAMGIIVLFMATMLVYAEPFASIEANVNQVTLIPFALLRSMMLAWVNIPRICALFALYIGVMGAQYAIELALKPSVPRYAVEAAVASSQVVVFAILFTAAYFDTLRQERQTLS